MPTIATIPGVVEAYVITASAMTFDGMRYLGNVSLTTTSGPGLAMRLRITASKLAGLTIQTECRRHVQMTLTTHGVDSSAPRDLTIDALAVTGKINEASIDWRAVAAAGTAVPDPRAMPGAGSVAGPIRITAAGLSASIIQLANPSFQPTAC